MTDLHKTEEMFEVEKQLDFMRYNQDNYAKLGFVL